jgi:hypothetical protein
MKQTPEHVANALLNSLEAAQAQIDFLTSHYTAKEAELLAAGFTKISVVSTLVWELQQNQEKLRDILRNLTPTIEDLLN